MKTAVSLKAHAIKLFSKQTTYLGKMVVTDNALWFLCASKGSGLLEGASVALGGAVGGALKGLADKNNYDDIPDDINEADLPQYKAKLPDSIIFEAGKIEKLQDNWLQKVIRWDGKKIFVPSSFSKALRAELSPWAKKHQIKTKGL